MKKFTTYTEIDMKGFELVVRLSDNYLFASIKQKVTLEYLKEIERTGSKQWKEWSREVQEQATFMGLKTYEDQKVKIIEREGVKIKHV
jgi:hypothetical protein